MNLQSREYWENNKPADMWASNCPLCSEKENLMYETLHWKVLQNKYPILGLAHHLMAVPKKHILLAKEIPDEVFLDYKNIEIFMSEFYKNQDYFTFMRESIHGRSLEHIHYHFLPGQIWYKDLENMLWKQGF